MTTTTPFSRGEALRTLISRTLVLVYFVKKNGETRRMLCRYEGGTVRRSLVQVFDVEKGATRVVNLATLQSIKAMPTRATQRPAPDRPAVPPQRSLDEARRLMHDSF